MLDDQQNDTAFDQWISLTEYHLGMAVKVKGQIFWYYQLNILYIQSQSINFTQSPIFYNVLFYIFFII